MLLAKALFDKFDNVDKTASLGKMALQPQHHLAFSNEIMTQRTLNTSSVILEKSKIVIDQMLFSRLINPDIANAMTELIWSWLHSINLRTIGPDPEFMYVNRIRVRTIVEWVATALQEVRVRIVCKELTPQWRESLKREGAPEEDIERRLANCWWTYDRAQQFTMTNSAATKEVTAVVESLLSLRKIVESDDPNDPNKTSKFKFIPGAEVDKRELSKWRKNISKLDPNQPLHPFTIESRSMDFRVKEHCTPKQRLLTERFGSGEAIMFAKPLGKSRKIADAARSIARTWQEDEDEDEALERELLAAMESKPGPAHASMRQKHEDEDDALERELLAAMESEPVPVHASAQVDGESTSCSDMVPTPIDQPSSWSSASAGPSTIMGTPMSIGAAGPPTVNASFKKRFSITLMERKVNERATKAIKSSLLDSAKKTFTTPAF